MVSSIEIINVFEKITAAYLMVLICLSCVLNPLILLVCIRSKTLRSNSTFKLLAFSSINDILTCFPWNFDGIAYSFFEIKPFYMNLFYCRVISVFLQFYTVQYSSWMLISISLDRLLSMNFKPWSKKIFTGYRPVMYAMLLTLIMIGINFNMVLYSGHSFIRNGTEVIVCYETLPGQSIDWYKLMTQVYVYFGCIVPYCILIVLNLLIIYKATRFERAQKAATSTRTTEERRGARRKAEMTRTILIITFLYIAFNIPGAVGGGYFFHELLFSPAGQTLLNILYGLQFSYPAFNFFILFFFNKMFAKEVKLFWNKIKGSTVSVASNIHSISLQNQVHQ